MEVVGIGPLLVWGKRDSLDPGKASLIPAAAFPVTPLLIPCYDPANSLFPKRSELGLKSCDSKALFAVTPRNFTKFC